MSIDPSDSLYPIAVLMYVVALFTRIFTLAKFSHKFHRVTEMWFLVEMNLKTMMLASDSTP